MTKKVHFLYHLFAGILLISCSGSSKKIKQAPSELRDSEPKVIRINMDRRPNMIAIPLGDQMYAGYDGLVGGLYKVWKGEIKFTGPVYDNLHGPQPLSKGTTYLSDELKNSPWFVGKEGERQNIKARYEGYVIKGDQVTLEYTLSLPSGEKIQIEETPGIIAGSALLNFSRSFKTSNVPSGVDVLLNTTFTHLAKEDDLKTDGKWTESSFTENTFDWGKSTSGKGLLKLNANGTTFINSSFAANVIPDPERKEEREEEEDGEEEEEEEGSPNETSSPHATTLETVSTSVSPEFDALVKLGKSTIVKSDCAACHMIDKAVIGPSYKMIAQKYESTMEMVGMLSGKIIQGGSGVWGERLMSPHPNLSEEESKSMAAYILSIVPDGDMVQKPGIVADFYQIGQPLPGLPEVVAGQNPNFSNVYPNIDFRSGNPDIGQDTDENFNGLKVDFVMEVNCYLNVPENKTYDLQFIANNGGKLSIDGKVVSQGEFYEGTFIDEIDIKLTEGAHKINIEFYHHLFDKYLILLWRDNKKEEYQPIPASAFTHNTYDVKATAPGLKNIVSNKAPGFGASLEKVHPSFDLSPVRPEGFEPRAGDIEFRKDGRLVVCTWDGQVYEMENVANGKSAEGISVTKIADGLCEPLGITEVDGEVYVLQRWELTKLVDHDGDRITDEYVNIATFGNRASFHEWSFGLIYKDGYFYCTTGIAMGWGSENMHIDRGKALKIAMDGSYSYVAHGLKEPNGIGFGPDGEIFVADNEGEWQPVCQIFHIPETGNPFYGNKSVEVDHLPEDLKPVPPVIWLPQNEIGNSPSQPILMHHGPYEGQMLHGEITHGGIKRDFIEKIKGQYQGAVFRFSQGLEVGINRIEWGPDGSLYAAGLGGAQDFGHRGHQFGLQRLTYNGNPAFEMLAIRAKTNGLEVEFTKPLRIGDGTSPEDYKIQQWYYIWTHEGESTQKRDLENLAVRSVTLSKDRKSVFLEIAGMKKEHVLYVQLQPTFLSENNEQLWSNEGWYTLNEFPDEAGIVSAYPFLNKLNTISSPELEAGWKSLFDGKTTTEWTANTTGWSVKKGELMGEGQNTILTTNQSFDDFELELEWKVEPGAEGGILFHVPAGKSVEKVLSVAPRMQLTDDKTEEARNVHTYKSGANYEVAAPYYLVTNPTNKYNHARLVVKGYQVEHWLNGIKVLEYELGSEEWAAGVKTSTYSRFADYGKASDGGIGLYSKRGKIWVRNIRVRPSGNKLTMK